MKIDSTFRKWSPRSFIDAIDPLLKSHVGNPYQLVSDVEKLTSSLIERAASSTDVFRIAEVRATAAASLLEFCDSSEQLDRYVCDTSLKVAEDIEVAVRRACAAIEKDRFALLSAKSGGLADLFYLPMRVTKILGWAGAAFHIKRLARLERTFDSENFERLVNLAIDNYSTSLVAMSDRQAPFAACSLTAMHRLGLKDAGETISSLLFNSAVACGGRVASFHLEAHKALAYLIQRRDQGVSSNTNLLANPTELLTVILKSARLFELEDTFDYDLSNFDHVTINAYIPETYRLYSQATVSGGINACFLIGTDIWTVNELEMSWPERADSPPETNAIGMGAILSSMLFDDRIPWFLFANDSGFPITAQRQLF